MATERTKPLTEGVWLLASGILIKSVIVAKKLADKLLSKAGVARGDVQGDTLSFPESDGRASIPMLELSQKGYLEQTDAQIKEHFNRLVQLLPDYLAERGLIKKSMETLDEKVEKEHRAYLNSIKYMKPQEISAASREIFEIQKIKEFICRSDLSGVSGLGLLMQKEDLLEDIRDRILAPENETTEDIVISNKAIDNMLESMVKELTQDKDAINTALLPFKNELEIARKNSTKAVTFTVAMPGGESHKMTMRTEDFYKALDKELLDRFAGVEMHDFPTPEYFGKDDAALYEKILEKRFCEDIADNFEDYCPEDGYGIVINSTSKKDFIENEYDGLKNRVALTTFAESEYKSPEKAIGNFKEFFSRQNTLLDNIRRLVEPIEPSTQTQTAVTNFDRTEDGEVVASEDVITQTETPSSAENKGDSRSESDIENGIYNILESPEEDVEEQQAEEQEAEEQEAEM